MAANEDNADQPIDEPPLWIGTCVWIDGEWCPLDHDDGDL